MTECFARHCHCQHFPLPSQIPQRKILYNEKVFWENPLESVWLITVRCFGSREINFLRISFHHHFNQCPKRVNLVFPDLSIPQIFTTTKTLQKLRKNFSFFLIRFLRFINFHKTCRLSSVVCTREQKSGKKVMKKGNFHIKFN